MSFVRVDCVTGRVLLVMKLRGIEDEKLSFRSEISDVCESGKFQIALSPEGNGARIEGIAFFGDRIDSIPDQAKSWLFGKWIHPGARRIGNQKHVGFVDCSPAANRRRVKAEPLFEF